jgi:hypothetical protein
VDVKGKNIDKCTSDVIVHKQNITLTNHTMKRAFIIHGWGGNPKEAWFPWLKKELEKRGFKAVVPQMPDAEHPKIKTWTNYLKKIVGKPDEQTYFVGHSIGCQTIIRYLEKLPKKAKVGGAVLVAGFIQLNLDAIEKEEPESSKIAMPWLKAPINWAKIKSHTKKFISIFSDNDPYVSDLINRKAFKSKLNARIIMEKKKGHMGGDSGIKKLKSVLDSVIKISQ